jgi:hypothetical protein
MDGNAATVLDVATMREVEELADFWKRVMPPLPENPS